MKEKSRVGARAVVLSVLLGLTGCAQDPEPNYIRISGAAPPVHHAPSTPAVLVVFWASWCAPCREETPQLVDMARNPPDGLGVATFSHDKSLIEVERHFGHTPDQSLNLRLDPNEETARAFGVDALPTSFLVINGRLAARFNGPRQWNSGPMRRLLRRMIESGAAGQL